uniref:neuroblastoma breakpoint family member 19-like n=2 Tax=Myxine glutinosa TaxID=7769 RepID=UPI00358E9A17
MPSCAAINCTNRQFGGCGRTFHLFPFGRPSLLQQWIHNVNRDKWTPSKKAVLCSHHFEVACFDRSGQTTRLRRDAVPTIFKFPTHLQKGQHHPKKRPKESVMNQPEPLAEIPTTDCTTPSKNPESPDASKVHSDHSYLTQESPLSVKRKLSVLEGRICQLKKSLKTTQQKYRRLRKKCQHLPGKLPKERVTNQPETLAEIPSTDCTTTSNNPESPDTSKIHSDHSYLTQESQTSVKRKLSVLEGRIRQLKKRLKTTQQKFRHLQKKSQHPPIKLPKESVTNQPEPLAEIPATDRTTPSKNPESPNASNVYSDHSYLTQESPTSVKKILSVLKDPIGQQKKHLKTTQQKTGHVQQKSQRPPRKPPNESVTNQPEPLVEIPAPEFNTPSNNPESPDASKVHSDHSYLTQESPRSGKRELSMLEDTISQLKKRLSMTQQKSSLLRKEGQHPPRKLPKESIMNEPVPLPEIPNNDCSTPSNNPESPDASKVYSDHSYLTEESPTSVKRNLSALKDPISQQEKHLKTTQEKSCHLQKTSQRPPRKPPNESVTNQPEPLVEIPAPEFNTPSNNPESPDASKVHSDHSYLTQESPRSGKRELSVLNDPISRLKESLTTSPQISCLLHKKGQHPPRKPPKESVMNQPEPLAEIPAIDCSTPSNNPETPDASKVYSDHSYLTQESPKSVKKMLSVLKGQIGQQKKHLKTTQQKTGHLRKEGQRPPIKLQKESVINQPELLAEIPATDCTTPSNNPETLDASKVYSDHSYLTQESPTSVKSKSSVLDDPISQLKKRLSMTQQNSCHLRKKGQHPPRKPPKESVMNQPEPLAEIPATDCTTPSNPESPEASKVYSDHSYLTQESPSVKRKQSVLDDPIIQMKMRLKTIQQKSRRLQKKSQHPPRKPPRESVTNQPEPLADIPPTNCSTPSNPQSPDASIVYSDHSYLTQESPTSAKRNLSVLEDRISQLKKHLKTTQQKSRRLRKKSQQLPRKPPKKESVTNPVEISATDCNTPSNNPETPDASNIYSDHSYLTQESPTSVKRKLSVLQDRLSQLKKRLKTTQ